ncbi:MAG: ABC transporter permease [Lautropia sp.]
MVSRGATNWPAIGVLLVALVLLAPLGALTVTAVTGFDAAAMAHLARTVLAESVAVSVALAAGTLVGTVAIGVGAAWFVERYRFPGHASLAWMLVLPLAMPTYVIAYAYTDLLQFSGPVQRWLRDAFGFAGRLPDVRSLPGAIVLFSFVLYPYVYLMARTALADVSRATIDSARLLGRSGVRLFTQVVVPLIAPAVVAGAMLVLMETLADVGATQYFGLPTFSAGIYRAWFALGNRSAALMLAVLLLVAIAVIFAVDHAARGRAKRVTSRTHRPWPPTALSGAPALAMAALMFTPVLLGFVLPCASLAWLLAGEPELTTNLARFGQWTRNSFVAGVIGASVVLVLAVGFVYTERFAGARGHRLLTMAATGLRFGYAVPGAVIALAILWPVATADRVLSDALGLSSSLLTNSMLALGYAYTLRFFAVGYGGIEAAIERITPSLDAAARSLGASRAAVFRRVHLPLLARPAMVAWMLVLIDVMKELPATLMLRPFNYDTLAVIAQQLAQDERLAEAALPSIAIVAIGVLPVILVSRLMRGKPVAAGAGSRRRTVATDFARLAPDATPDALRSRP